MSVIVFAIVVILLICLLLWAINMLTMLPNTPRQLLMALVVILGVLAIGNRAGLF